uniref:PRLI-interacting factor A n=1 Tax=Leersia perrieri TaxID=77586 RepID=A0A0D9XGI6_9ORYZ
MNDPMMRPPAQYQMWPAPPLPPPSAAAAMEMLPVLFVGGGKPARPAWKRVARQPGWKRKAPPAAAARWGSAAAPRNTTSYLIRAKRAGGVASLVSPCPVTPAVLPTPQLSPVREVVGEMAKEKWGVDGYGSMKGLIRLRSQVADVLPGDDSGSGESDVEEHVEVERRLDHDLSRFEMLQLPAAAGEDEDEEDDDDDEARAARLEEENLTLRERLFLMERDMDDLRRRLLAVESLCRDRHRDGCVVDAAAGVGAAEETVVSESVAGVDLAGVGGDDTDTAADAMKA